MHATRHDDAAAFVDHCGDWLGEREARHSLILGVAMILVEEPEVYPEHHQWVIDMDGAPVAAALVTPPHHLIVADIVRRPAVDALARLVAASGVAITGVIGNRPTVDRFAAAWAAHTGSAIEIVMEQGVFAADTILAASPIAGGWRPAVRSDLALLVEWWQAFLEEALPGLPHHPDDTRSTVEQRLAGPMSTVAVWEHDGEILSMCGWGRPTPTGVTIGPVYTPPGLRGRGSASALVGAVSAWQLATGRRFCCLYTDLSNPTSNGIYRRLGYRQIAESRDLAFHR